MSSSLAGAQPDAMFREMSAYYSGLDGFWDAVTAHATLPVNVTIDDLKNCPGCYPGVQVDAQFLSAVETDVIEPMRRVQQLISAHPQITRLYTTMSANEMTVDPLFTFNPDLDAVGNVHTATRVIECAAGYFQDEAPWRIELPHGGVIRGGPSDLGNWPGAFDSQPSNRLILRQGESGQGKVLEDNTKAIATAVANYNKTVVAPPRRSSSVVGGCSISGVSTRGASAGGGSFFALAGLALGVLRRRRAR
jgi:MYXO-CTERM domain-containing protein